LGYSNILLYYFMLSVVSYCYCHCEDCLIRLSLFCLSSLWCFMKYSAFVLCESW
jgi:hypothetical protein